MNYYEEIKNKIINNEIYCKVKDYSKERNTVTTYFEIGRLLTEAGKTYGESIIENYSKKLLLDVGKKYNARTLRRMRQLYLFFENQKWSPLGTKLSVSHIRELFCLKDVNEINYYAMICEKENISRDKLKQKIKSQEYERLSESTKTKLISNEQHLLLDLVKNPILIKNTNKYTEISEKVLQQIILEDIKNFMQELGSGFSFVSNEYSIKLGDKYNYIDLLLYNYKYKCFVVIELKITKLKKEHTGQIQNYMNYIDKNIKEIDDNNTVGIIICKKDDHFVIDYCSDKRIISREFELV